MSYPPTPQPDDPTISRRRAEAIKPFVDAALSGLDGLHPGGYPGAWSIWRRFTLDEMRELVEAFKPGR